MTALKLYVITVTACRGAARKGQGANDTIQGFAGNDVIDGGAGQDAAVVPIPTTIF